MISDSSNRWRPTPLSILSLYQSQQAAVLGQSHDIANPLAFAPAQHLPAAKARVGPQHDANKCNKRGFATCMDTQIKIP
jgi:hypothetical protein